MSETGTTFLPAPKGWAGPHRWGGQGRTERVGEAAHMGWARQHRRGGQGRADGVGVVAPCPAHGARPPTLGVGIRRTHLPGTRCAPYPTEGAGRGTHLARPRVCALPTPDQEGTGHAPRHPGVHPHRRTARPHPEAPYGRDFNRGTIAGADTVPATRHARDHPREKATTSARGLGFESPHAESDHSRNSPHIARF